MDTQRSRTWAEIDLQALHDNLHVVREQAPGAAVLAVVKANAYGHGLTKVCQSLANDVAYFGVAAMSEASLIRKALEGRPSPSFLIMGSTLPEELPKAITRGWHLAISSISECQIAGDVAASLGLKAQVHLVTDTGMGRMGALPENFLPLCQFAREQPHLEIRGLASHLSSADEDQPFTERQLQQFDDLTTNSLSLWPSDDQPARHLLNSAGIFRQGHLASKALVRPGLMLYGCAPESAYQHLVTPVMTVKSRVRLVRELPADHPISYGHTYITTKPTTVATVGIGYGDGFPRSLTGQGAEVLIQGQRCPLLGRVTMDQIMVDVSALNKPIQASEEVIILGRQGDETISLAEFAKKAQTIPWEILTGITGRVCRQYRGLASPASG